MPPHARIIGLVLALAALCTATVSAQAPADRLTPASGRITDEAITHDQALLRAWYRRAAALPDTGSADAVYARALALGFFRFAFDEYTDNDRTAIVDEAFAYGRQVTLESEAGVPDRDSLPRLTNTAPTRPDLWQRVTRLHAPAARACAPAVIARAVVELVRAGHEATEGASCHAEPHEREAERLLAEADSLVVACAGRPASSRPSDTTAIPIPVPADTSRPPMPTPEVPAAAPPRHAPPVAVTSDSIPSTVHFAFDSRTLEPSSRRVLDEVVTGLRNLPDSIRLIVTGHTDVQGGDRYNTRLSARRAEAVKRYLVAHGIAESRISTRAEGKRDPLSQARSHQAQARNRRVELSLERTDPVAVVLTPQDADLQLRRTRPHRGDAWRKRAR